MKVGTRKTLFLTSGLAGVVVLAVWCFLPSEPTYQGKELSYWLEPYKFGGAETTDARGAAFRSMGETAIPLLVRRLKWKPSGLMQVLHRRFPNWIRGIAYVQGNSDPRSEASYALGEIGSAARPALPVLEALTKVSDLPSSWYVNMASKAAVIKIKGESLDPYIEELRDTSDITRWYPKALLVGQFGTNAAGAVPLLLASLNPTNHSLVHGHALIALGQIRSQPEVCVPAIASFLSAPSVSSRQKAIGALLHFGPAARSATPQIVQSLADSDPWTRQRATNALKRIDPEAARRAGIP